MAPEGPGQSIYDFLYVHDQRISSIYSQLFSGLLREVRDVEASKTGDRDATSAALPAKVLGYEAAQSRESGQETHRTMLPHDSIILDVMGRMASDGLLRDGLQGAAHGHVVRFECRIEFFDATNLHEFLKAISGGLLRQIVPSSPDRDAKKNWRDLESARQAIGAIHAMYPFGVQVRLLPLGGGAPAWGNLERSSLRDAPSSITLKHGVRLSGSWIVYAVVDAVPGDEIRSEEGQTSGFLRGIEAVASLVRKELGRRHDEFGVTPLVIVRRLSGNGTAAA